jgi:hypothetical protein
VVSDADEWDDEANCQTCQGDGFCECEDSDSAEGCWEADCDGTLHTCPNCKGSGLAKNQWYF